MTWIDIDDQRTHWAAAVVLACIAAGCVSRTEGSASTAGDTAATDPGSAGADAAPTSGTIERTTSTTAPTTSADVGPTQPATDGVDSADSGSSSSAGGSSTTSGANACEPQPWFLCTDPWDCRGEVAQDSLSLGCGGVTSFFDEDGCPRPLCVDDADCPETMRCHDPVAEGCVNGGCLGTNFGCGDTEYQGRTICGCASDGACGSRVCVPTDRYPPGYCDPV